ncbi:MAG: aquaporin, partial [Gardnerella vaginalis]
MWYKSKSSKTIKKDRRTMQHSFTVMLAAEFIGTAILMIFGNGAVANVELKNTKGHHAGWLNIAMGYGFGVMFPVLMFGGISEAHINPAMTIAQAANGMFPWQNVAPYIVAQLLGALVGQLIVYVTYLPHYNETEEPGAIL